MACHGSHLRLQDLKDRGDAVPGDLELRGQAFDVGLHPPVLEHLLRSHLPTTAMVVRMVPGLETAADLVERLLELGQALGAFDDDGDEVAKVDAAPLGTPRPSLVEHEALQAGQLAPNRGALPVRLRHAGRRLAVRAHEPVDRARNRPARPDRLVDDEWELRHGERGRFTSARLQRGQWT